MIWTRLGILAGGALLIWADTATLRFAIGHEYDGEVALMLLAVNLGAGFAAWFVTRRFAARLEHQGGGRFLGRWFARFCLAASAVILPLWIWRGVFWVAERAGDHPMACLMGLCGLLCWIGSYRLRDIIRDLENCPEQAAKRYPARELWFARLMVRVGRLFRRSR